MDNFWSNAKKKDKVGGIKELLRNIPLFEQLTDRELTGIQRILHERRYKAGEEIFRQGEPGIAMYIIETGGVLIKVGGTDKVLAALHDGEFFGELALLDDSPRSASAVASAETKIFAFSQPDLFGVMERNPQLGLKIILALARIIGERLKRMNSQLQTAENQVA
ncbi:MAG: cyclic nucleotide-binding domain-containing protein [Bacteroidota bacterium]